MTIKNVLIDKTSESGVFPKIIQLETDNTLAEVMATGFLNKLYKQGFPLDQRQMALVSTKTTPVTSTSVCYLMTVDKTGSDWSLVAPISTEMLEDGSVTLAKLATGITPSHIVVYAGKESDGGGGATIAITQAGVLTTDIVFAQVEASTNAVEVQKVTPTVDTVTVLLSGDPGASTEIAWQVLRAAS